MIKIASIEWNRFALETILNLLALALQAYQLHFLHIFTLLAVGYVPLDEEQLMSFITVHSPQS